MSQVLEKTGLSADWMPAESLPVGALPRALAGLITEAGSLTERLRSASVSEFSVRVLRQETCDLREFPDHLLVDRAGSGLLREVYLVSDGRPAVFAQTLVPSQTLSRHRWLSTLGDEPLGPELFSRSDIHRMAFDFAHLTSADHLARCACRGLDTGMESRPDLWARRSLFLLSGHPVSVNEVFFSGAIPSAAR